MITPIITIFFSAIGLCTVYLDMPKWLLFFVFGIGFITILTTSLIEYFMYKTMLDSFKMRSEINTDKISELESMVSYQREEVEELHHKLSLKRVGETYET